MEGEKRIRKRYDDAAGLAVADFKTPLSKEVRSTSVIVNVGSSVGQAFHDRRRTKDRELNPMGGREGEGGEREREIASFSNHIDCRFFRNTLAADK